VIGAKLAAFEIEQGLKLFRSFQSLHMRPVLLLVIAAAMTVGAAAQTGEKKVEVSFCDLAPPESVRHTGPSFTEMFRFKLLTSESPSAAVRIRGEHIAAADVSRCIRSWKFKNFTAGDLFLIAFRWEHPGGWKELRVVSKDYDETTPAKTKSENHNP